ncbi:hypothetical protein N7517_010595 [Penicillium concentricum]|uniref:Subtelomeric hrmA-associated cluster protein AFUB-079030/YDR124W-like helical bundle domain-containing protein n=1 Tax=Penicillium concentricum TaxID=293559 RepID=A0A9W9R9C8_9EURO|nr:uncharacterized protein N7517_010595 [Penicillium concentricum]KAJ5355986.1 hypothetical protein N7517_010595 [Penicillium concentricum]
MDPDTNDSMAYHTPITIDGKLGRPHFAHISVDVEGSLHLQCSQSIANTFQGPLSIGLADTFLKAVAMSEEVCSPITQAAAHQTTLAIRNTLPSPRITHTSHRTGLDGKGQTRNSPPPSLSPPTVGPAHTEPSRRWDTPILERTKRNVWSNDNRMWRPEVAISVIDRNFLRKYYAKAFENLQQTNCRALAKAYVKLVEPRKQVFFPYNGRAVVAGVIRQLDPEATKPPWWPPGVRHREPDHLLKHERIRLLVHILCELHTSHGITTKKLREADQPIRRYIVPAERVCIFDEVYRVRQEEVELLEGKSDGLRQVWICRMNLPEAARIISNRNQRSGDGTPFDAPSKTISSNLSACVKSPPTNHAPPALFAPVANFPAHLPLDYPCDVQGQFPRKYSSPDPKTTRGFDMTMPVSMPPHVLKRKREGEGIAEVDATRPTIFIPDLSSSVIPNLQPCPLEYHSGPYSSLQQNFVSHGLSTAEELGQPNEGRDISYQFGYN